MRSRVFKSQGSGVLGILNQNTGQRVGFFAQNNLEMVIGSVVQDEVLE